MKRRPFLASLAALFTAPFVAKKAVAGTVTTYQLGSQAEGRKTATALRAWAPPHQGTEYVVSVDWQNTRCLHPIDTPKCFSITLPTNSRTERAQQNGGLIFSGNQPRFEL